MSKDTISVNMNIYDIPILVEQLEKANKEIKRLKEEYIILQNASDEVEEEKDKEIERLNNIINGIEERINQDIKNLFQERLTVKKIYTADEILNIIKELKGSDKE